MSDALIDLAERCEKATGANKMLDEAIYEAVGIAPSRRDSFVYPYYAFTASLDAAATLVPRGMLFAITNCGAQGREPDFTKATAMVGRADDPAHCDPVEAATAALALCSAALRARASVPA